MNDTDLIRKAQQGDQDAMAILLQQHYDFLLKYLYKITLHPSLSEDLAQETMIRCMENLHRYNGTSKFSSWMITIASRIYVDTLRRKKRERSFREAELRELGIRKLKWYSLQAGEEWHDVLDVLSELSDELRLPVIMKYYYGYKQEEIAEMLEIKVGTVKSRIHQGLKKIRKGLDNDEKRQR